MGDNEGPHGEDYKARYLLEESLKTVLKIERRNVEN